MFFIFPAGPRGLEPRTARLECDVLPLKLWTRTGQCNAKVPKIQSYRRRRAREVGKSVFIFPSRGEQYKALDHKAISAV